MQKLLQSRRIWSRLKVTCSRHIALRHSFGYRGPFNNVVKLSFNPGILTQHLGLRARLQDPLEIIATKCGFDRLREAAAAVLPFAQCCFLDVLDIHLQRHSCVPSVYRVVYRKGRLRAVIVEKQVSQRDDWCPGEDSNLHVLQHWYLKPARLPIPPPGQVSWGRCSQADRGSQRGLKENLGAHRKIWKICRGE